MISSSTLKLRLASVAVVAFAAIALGQALPAIAQTSTVVVPATPGYTLTAPVNSANQACGAAGSASVSDASSTICGRGGVTVTPWDATTMVGMLSSAQAANQQSAIYNAQSTANDTTANTNSQQALTTISNTSTTTYNATIVATAANTLAQTANSYATSASNVSNSSNTVATNSYNLSNAANSTAGSATNYSNVANSVASNAYNYANAANSTAYNANAVANGAYATSLSANNVAGQSYNMSVASQNTANAAYNNAGAPRAGGAITNIYQGSCGGFFVVYTTGQGTMNEQSSNACGSNGG